jgi:hypothetical protein
MYIEQFTVTVLHTPPIQYTGIYHQETETQEHKRTHIHTTLDRTPKHHKIKHATQTRKKPDIPTPTVTT